MIRSRKRIWIFLIIVALIYVGLFFFIRSQISGSFVLDKGTLGKTITSESTYFGDLPDVITLNVNEPYYFKVDHDLGYEFSDNSPFFDIEPNTGEISFTPTEQGTHYVVIIAMRDITDFQAKPIRFVVGP